MKPPSWILCADNSPETGHFFERLHVERNLAPRFLIAHVDEYPKAIGQRLGTTTVDFHRANFGTLVTEGPQLVPATRATSVNVRNRDYLHLLKSFDRYDTGQLSFSAREALASKVLSLAGRLLDASEAETVLFLDVPHWPVQLALDALSRSRGLRRPTLKAMHVIPELRPFCLPFSGHDGPSVPVNRRQDATPLESVLAAAESVHDRLMGSSPVLQGTARERSLTFTRPPRLRSAFAYSNQMAIRSASIQSLESALADPSKKRIGWRPERRWIINQLRSRSTRNARRVVLRAALDSVPMDSNSAVFFLQVEPEGTVTPGGSSFSSQADAVRVYRSILPSEVQLYVQEHPDLLNKSIVSRSPLLYSAINQMPSTEMVSPGSVDRRRLEDLHSIGTLTGSVGVEAVAQGGKAYVFGSAWYRDCLGFERVTGVEPWEVHESVLRGEDLAQHARNFLRNHAVPHPRRSMTEKEFSNLAVVLSDVLLGGEL